jgi:serine protease Do
MNRWVASFAARWLVVLFVLLMPLTGSGQNQRRDVPRSFLVVFRDVVKEAAKSTVQVYSDGYRAALGAVVRADGYIATKASEVVSKTGEPTGKLEVQLSFEKQKREARLIAKDLATDLAILKIDASNLPVVSWSASEAPAVGTWLVTAGFSQDPLSYGVVSVPARRLLPNAALGVRLDQDERVARISAVVTGLAAEQAGMRDGDIIRRLNGEEIKGTVKLQQAIRSHFPGEKISLVVERDGKMQNMEVTLGSMTDFGRDERSDFQNTLGGSLSERRSGFPLAIQHDSVLKPIDCGGPVVDLDGKVVGLNIARAGRVESYALPSSVVRETIDKLLKTELTSTSAPADDKNVSRKLPQER